MNKTLRLALLAPFCVLVFAAGDETTIRQLRTTHNQAIADRDRDGLTAVWRSDIQVTISSGTHLRGAEAYLEAFQTVFKNIPGVSFVRTPLQIRISENGTVASEQGHWVGTYPNRTPRQTTGTYLACWRKNENGTWLISAELYIPLQSRP